MCDDPEFALETPKKKISGTISEPAMRDRAKSMVKTGDARVVLLTRIVGAWRKTFTKMERDTPDDKPERKVEFDSGYYARIAPLGYFVLACPDSRCGKTAEQILAVGAVRWSAPIGKERKVLVTCDRGACSGKVAQ